MLFCEIEYSLYIWLSSILKMWVKKSAKTYAYITKIRHVSFVISILTIRRGKDSQRNLFWKRKAKNKINNNIKPTDLKHRLFLNGKCIYCILYDLGKETIVNV